MKNVSLGNLGNGARAGLQAVLRYRVIIFIALVVGIYGYLAYRINVLSSAQPNPATSTTTTVQATPRPHIDQSIVNQLEQLKDNSVNVKALFNSDRSNPFNEP